MVCSLGKTLFIQFPQTENQYLWALGMLQEKSFPVGLGVMWSRPWAEDLSCLVLEEFRFEEYSFFPIEIFIDLYKNTTFNLKSPLASSYKHRKCYWALEISFNEGKVFLLKSEFFFFSLHTTSSEEPGKLDCSGLWENEPTHASPMMWSHRLWKARKGQ